ncbi:MAG: aminotransferase class V-fold PLP-dependent enzyme [Calditrichaeota bacterium]|nr:aminotransferase class V-fold PLP-dependent enzyme [Calditrichota bacterium]
MAEPVTYRQLFPHIDQGVVYLNHAAVSPMHRRALQAMEDYFQERMVGDIEYWPRAMEKKQLLKQHIARLIHASAEHIALVNNTSTGLNILANGLDWKPGDRILLNDFEFPANVYPFLNLRRRGVEIDFVPHRNGRILLDDLAARITPRTRLLTISFVEFLNGFRNDLVAIGELCRQHGLIFCVDGIQGVGALQLDVQATGIDFLANGGQKWLMWPLGMAFVYVSPRLFDQLHPAFAGWLSVEQAWDFFDYRLAFLPDASRFEPGTHNVPGIIGALASTELFLEIGMARIEAHILHLAGKLIQELQQRGYRLFTPTEEKFRSGIVTFYHDRAESLFDYLKQQHIHVSLREGMIRVSPHFYNTEGDIAAFLNALEDFDQKHARG